LILLLDEGFTLTKVYRVQDFAKLAGVTVRALHHYDRLGLLRPNRTEAGYRLYYLRDLERLEQIVALKFLGIPLKQIRRMFQRGTSEMSDSLEKQRRVLEEKRRLLDSAIRAIEEAEKATAPGIRPDSAILKKIIEVIEMQDNMDWSKKYYSAAAQVEGMVGSVPRCRSGARGGPCRCQGAGFVGALEKARGRFHRRRPADHRGSRQNVSGPPQLAGQHAATHRAVQQQESVGVHREGLRRRKDRQLTF